MKKTIKIFIYLVLPVLLVLILAVLIVLPYGIKKYINEHGNEYTGRKMSVQEVKISYLSSTFRVIDFKLCEADGKTNFVSFDTLLVKISPFPLLSSKLVVEKFRLVRPEITIVRKDSLYNFDDILVFINSKPKTESSEQPSAPFKYFLKNIAMEQGENIIYR